MSEAFLSELLQKSNIVSLEGEQCGICLEEYNTPSRETGTSEVAIRLPCNHIIGSACIATWLKDTNSTCPICRREFFQAQSRPHFEHGVFDGEESEDEGDEREATEIIEDFCDQLGLDMEVSMISKYLFQNLIDSWVLDESHTERCVIAVSIYMGSHITRNPVSPREIAEIAGVDAGHIRETYDTIHPEHDELTDVRMLSLLEQAFDETDPGRLNWPVPGNAVTDVEIERQRDLKMLQERCEQGCNELDLGPVITGIAVRITTRYFTAGAMLQLHSREMTAASIFIQLHWRDMPAASILMASQMMWQSISYERVAGALRMDESRVRDAFGAAFLHREILRREPQLQGSPGQSMESLLGRIPPP